MATSGRHGVCLNVGSDPDRDPAPAPEVEVAGFDDFVEIGRGGSSVVYAARQIGLDRPVAVKVLQTPMRDAATRRRFERECAALGHISELEGIVDTYATAYTTDGRGCIVMRRFEGVARR